MGGGFVLDASVAIRWALLDGSVADRTYADRVLDSLATGFALVPALWYTETIHVLRCAEDDGKLGESALTVLSIDCGSCPSSPTRLRQRIFSWPWGRYRGSSVYPATTRNTSSWPAAERCRWRRWTGPCARRRSGQASRCISRKDRLEVHLW